LSGKGKTKSVSTKDAHHISESVVGKEHVKDKRMTRDHVVLLQLDLQLHLLVLLQLSFVVLLQLYFVVLLQLYLQLYLLVLLIFYSATATAAAGGGPAAASECVLLYQ
jgi:hypothetical protein